MSGKVVFALLLAGPTALALGLAINEARRRHWLRALCYLMGAVCFWLAAPAVLAWALACIARGV